MDPVSYPHSDITLKMPEYWDQHPCPEHHALPLFLAPPYFPYFLLSASSPMKKKSVFSISRCLTRRIFRLSIQKLVRNPPLVCPFISLPSTGSLQETWYLLSYAFRASPHLTHPFPDRGICFSPFLRKGRMADGEHEFGERRMEKYRFWNVKIVSLVVEAN